MKGFTLVEVLVSLLLVSVIVVPLVGLLNRSSMEQNLLDKIAAKNIGVAVMEETLFTGKIDGVESIFPYGEIFYQVKTKVGATGALKKATIIVSRHGRELVRLSRDIR